jgi:phenylalanyl-tRNA synthetase beta chain
VEVTLAAADRAVQLLQRAGRRPGGGSLGAPASPPTRHPLQLRRDALHNLLGPVLVEAEPGDLEDARIEATLTALGCELVAERRAGW